MRIQIGISRKRGERNFGSRGASLTMEVEVEDDIAADPQRLRDRVRSLYAMARNHVNEELATGTGFTDSRQLVAGNSSALPSTSTPIPDHSPSHASDATPSQVRAVYALARKHELEPCGLSQERFGVAQPEGLTRRQASNLISELSATPTPSRV